MFILNKASERQKAGHGNFSIHIVMPGRNASMGDSGFYTLGRFDDAHLKPGAFVGMHPHQNDEILTLMRSGTMLHKDSTGKEIAVTPENIMLMNAGSGIYHEESIPAERFKDDVRLLQIFIRPEKENSPPQVQFANAGRLVPGRWRLVAGPKSSNAPLEIRSNILVYDMEMSSGISQLPGACFTRTAFFVYVFEGDLNVNEISLKQGDSIITENENESLLTNTGCSIVCFLIDKEASYTKNGMYSGMRR